MQDTTYTTNNGDAMVKPKRMHTEAATCVQHHKYLPSEQGWGWLQISDYDYDYDYDYG